MSSPEFDHVDVDLLAAVALDESVNDEVRAHVDGCERCAGEVAALREVVALARAGRNEELLAPRTSVWEAVRAEVAPARVTPIRRFAKVPTWLAVTAATVAMAAGVGLGSVVTTPDEPDPAPQAQVLGAAALTTLDDAAEYRGAAEVRRHDDRIVLHVAASDLGGDDGIREVWLINVDGARMVSLGLLTAGESGDFDFPERLLDEGYRIVDISVEPDDGDPTHSGDSLARGTIEG